MQIYAKRVRAVEVIQVAYRLHLRTMGWITLVFESVKLDKVSKQKQVVIVQKMSKAAARHSLSAARQSIAGVGSRLSMAGGVASLDSNEELDQMRQRIMKKNRISVAARKSMAGEQAAAADDWEMEQAELEAERTVMALWGEAPIDSEFDLKALLARPYLL